MVDYMVVGLGLAGTAFCETLRRNNKTFVVYNNQSQTSSRVAGGLYNPIILNRFTLSWRADEQLAVSADFYKQLEQFLNIQFDEKLNVLRKFASIEEQNLWFEAADKNSLKPYLDTQLVSNKGEYLVIEAKGLLERNIIKSSIFLIPLGDDLYKVGATYNRDQKDNSITEASKEELQRKLDSLLNCSYKVIGQEAGVRPTVKDRRPLVGKHPKYNNLWVLNGFGSHGIMIAPWASKALYEQIEMEAPILAEMDIARFNKN